MPYGTDLDSQIVAFGVQNTSFDAKTTAFRKLATTVINAELNLEFDIASPSEGIDNICNLLTAAFLTTKPGEQKASPFWEMGIDLLQKWRGDDPEDAHWGITIPTERFHGFVSRGEFLPHSFVD